MTEKNILSWINLNLGVFIERAIDKTKEKTPNLIYTKDWLASMAMREVGFLIARYAEQKMKPEVIHTLMRGDYTQRHDVGETEKQFHGFSYWQIDIGSFPDFIKSGDWKDPFKACCKAIDILEDKRIYLAPKFPNLQGDSLERAITAAYNCGEGNVKKVLNAGNDIDERTFNHDYSAEVWRFREIFNSL